MACPLPDDQVGKRVATANAGLTMTASSVNGQPVLILADLPGAIPIARERGASVVDCSAEHVDYCVDETVDFVVRECSAGSLRMDSSQKKGFVRIYIPDSCNDALVEQQTLDRRRSAAKHAPQIS
jgi:hypothetical protein